MATTKLTLSIPEYLIGPVKEYASKKHTSVSKIFADLMAREIETETSSSKDDEFLEKIKKIKVSPEIEALSGILKGFVPDDVDLKDLKYEYLKNKYGL